MRKLYILLLSLATCLLSLVSVKAQELMQAAPHDINNTLIHAINTERNNGNNQVDASCCSGGPPANDNFAGATALTVGSPTVAGNTCGATVEAGESLGCNAAAAPNQTVWYSFVATATTTYVQFTATGGCVMGSCIWSAATVPTNCGSLACHPSNINPQLYQLTTVVGQTYQVQITNASGGPCGSGSCFTIAVSNTAPAGTITNPPQSGSVTAPIGECWLCYQKYDV